MDPNLEAARRGGGVHSALPTVQQIYSVGPANITSEADRDKMVDLVLCAHFGRHLWDAWDFFLDSTTSRAHNVWINVRRGTAGMSTLIKVITLLCDIPADVSDGISSQHIELIEEGRQLRARFPAYLEQRSALLVTHCPLPVVLQEVVAAYAEPTRVDVWDSRLL
jgi:hypothetical protein